MSAARRRGRRASGKAAVLGLIVGMPLVARCICVNVPILVGWYPVAATSRQAVLWGAVARHPDLLQAPRPASVVRILQHFAGLLGLAGVPRSPEVAVSMEQLEPNVRRINSTCLVDSSVEEAWSIITDYDRLGEYVPNLVVSRLVPHPEPDGIRLFQEGAQKIAGFEFRASVTLDMTEARRDVPDGGPCLAVGFSLVESQTFQEFSGEWRVRSSDCRRSDAAEEGGNFTELFYTVTIKPRGLVPVAALEWRIREDVSVNMLAMKAAAERLRAGTRAAAADKLPPGTA